MRRLHQYMVLVAVTCVFVMFSSLKYSHAGLNEKLFNAVKRGDTNAVGALLAKGADVNAKGFEGLTPLMWASHKGHKEVAELLISEGADVNAKDATGETPLMVASMNGHKEVAELLISKGADVNAKDATGETPLMLAEKRRHKEVVQLLQRYNAEQSDERWKDAIERMNKGLEEEYGIEVKESCPEETEEEIYQATESAWSKMSKAMIAGDLETALTYFSVFDRESNRSYFSGLCKEKLRGIFGNSEAIGIKTLYKDVDVAMIEVIRGEYSYEARFKRDPDCTWRVSGM